MMMVGGGCQVEENARWRGVVRGREEASVRLRSRECLFVGSHKVDSKVVATGRDRLIEHAQRMRCRFHRGEKRNYGRQSQEIRKEQIFSPPRVRARQEPEARSSSVCYRGSLMGPIAHPLRFVKAGSFQKSATPTAGRPQRMRVRV